MSNFTFLQAEFPFFMQHAQAVESLVNTDARSASIRSRHSLELVVNWLYDNDRELQRPYDRNLNALISQPDFRHLLGNTVWEKARLIQKEGNFAAHGNRSIKPYQAQQLCQELFHILYWLARHYSRNAANRPDPGLRFDAAKMQRLVTIKEAADFAKKHSKSELQKQEQEHQAVMAKVHAEAEARDNAVETRLAEIAEREAALAASEQKAQQRLTLVQKREAALQDVDAVVAAKQRELAAAKKAASQEQDQHDYNEAATRKHLIDVLLVEAGRTIGSDADEEVEVSGMPNEKGIGFVDYVLWGKDGKPLAVVEAKRTLKDPNVGKQQAKLYADCLEAKHGVRPIIFYTNGYQTWLWDDCQSPPRDVQGFYTQDELELAILRRSSVINPITLTINTDIAGRYYQHRAITSLSEAFNNGQRAGLLTMATGTGKTRTAVALVDLLMRANLVKRVLFLADRKALVTQAVNAFKEHLPDSSPVNLVSEKDGVGRVFVSTYPTMMGLIDEQDDGSRRYSVGHFDLVIVDEAHRSIYQKYSAIFDYFDARLVGLTATPKAEVHQDTYRVFGLETGVPTDAYTLDEAVSDGFLTPYKAFDVPLKFVREGVKYDELCDDDKEHWDSLDWGDENEGHAPDAINASEINKKLFNIDTVDKMLAHLMQNGLKVQGGDRLGKTVIFAVNQRHADFISERFDENYPHLKGKFARVITHSVNYAQSLIEEFKAANGNPHLAISVDMLDTGIDVPEILNLVFFKAVRSKVKFLQMIGRGTRLCEDLFGPEQDKAEFHIFDYCGNFEYFNEHPDGAAATLQEPLGKKLFRTRTELLARLQHDRQAGNEIAEAAPDYVKPGATVEDGLAELLWKEVSEMNLDNFIVRPQGEHVRHFAKKESWHSLDDSALARAVSHVAGLPSQLEQEHITAKLFDLSCLNLQVALLDKSAAYADIQNRIISIAEQLETKATVPAVRVQLELIEAVQSEEFWKDITLGSVENMRLNLRALVQLIEKTQQTIVYSALADEMGAVTVIDQANPTATGININQYRKKVERYIKEHQDHIAIARLRRALPLTEKDLDELERLVFESGEVQGKEQFAKAYGDDVSLPLFIRRLVGLDRNAALEAFGAFLDTGKYNSSQIRFVEMIISQLTANGEMDAGQLYEAPFTSVHYEGLEGVFPGKDGDALIGVVTRIGTIAA